VRIRYLLGFFDFPGKSLHYILDVCEFVRQREAEAVEQDREVLFRPADGPKTDFPAGPGGQRDVHRALLRISVDRMNARVRKFGLIRPSWRVNR